MTSDLDTGGESSTELRRRSVFRLQIWVGAGCYVAASFALGLWGHGVGGWRFVLAVLPLLAVVWMVIVIVRRVRQMDEYQIKLFFPGLAAGFIVSMIAALTLGTLGSAGLNLPNGGWIVAVLGLLSWEFTNLLTGAAKA
jgi:hypothetical protein